MEKHIKKIAIIGGGAAGFFTALNINTEKFEVHLYEATQKLLAKVKVSGGGRCNVTHNNFNVSELAQNYPRGKQQMKKSLKHFQPKDVIKWFESRGVKLVAESDGRMFPAANSSKAIIDCFMNEAKKNNVVIHKGKRLEVIKDQGEDFQLQFKDQTITDVDYLVIAAGGYPPLIEAVKKYGHKPVSPAPSLFTFKISSPYIEGLQGLSFPKVKLRMKIGGNKYETYGPLLITHWGVSGPAALKLSAFAARDLFDCLYRAELSVDLLPDEDIQTLLERYTKMNSSKKKIGNLDIFDLPKRFVERLLAIHYPKEIPSGRDMSKKNWNRLVEDVKNLKLMIDGKGVFKEEFVTSGGIDTAELVSSSMESKKRTGLYFAGEVLNIDGVTGGFNFQNAWSSGYLVSQDLNQKK